MNHPENISEIVLAQIELGRTPREIAEELASQGVTTRTGKPFDRKAVNNIVTHSRMESQPKKDKMKDKKTSEGTITQTKSGSYCYRKTHHGKLIVNKTLPTKKEAVEFKRNFLKNFKEEDYADTSTTPKKAKKLKAEKAPELQQFSMSDFNKSGFVIIMGKDSNLLKQIINQIEL